MTITKQKPIESDLQIDNQAEIITETEAVPLTWLTLESLLIGVILMVGLALRLWNLGHYPLSDGEALQSLIALRIFGVTLLETSNYSPLLVSLNGLIFLLFQESDATARLVSAILGTVLVILPFSLRRQLGATVCLLSAGLLAISPTALFLSRTLNTEIAVVVGALLIVSGFFNWTEDGQRRWLYLLAGGLAIMLTAGAMAYSILVVFAVIILLKLAAFTSLWTQGLSYSTDGSTLNEHDKEDEAEERAFNLNPDLQQAGIFFLVAIILLSTAATFNLNGFGVMTSLVGDWLSRFGLQARPNAGFNAVFLLTIYEPFLVIGGLVGLAYAILNGSLLRFAFVGWFIGALILDLLMGGRPGGNVILSLVPLAFLVAFALADLGEDLLRWGEWSNEGLILASGLVIGSFGYIGLTAWAVRDCAADDTFCQFAWLQAVAALALFVVIVAFFAFAVGGLGVAARGAALTGVAIGLLAAINIGWRLNYGPLMNLAYQPLAGIPVSTELIALKDTLSSEAMVRAGDKSLLDITLVGPIRPSLQWQLRDYERLTHINSIVESPMTTAIITPASVGGEEDDFGLGEAYIGQDFAVDAIWSPVGMQPKALINWLIFREASDRPQSNQVVLWLRLEEP